MKLIIGILLGLWALLGFAFFNMDPMYTAESYNDDADFDFGVFWYGPIVWVLFLLIVLVYLLGLLSEPLIEFIRKLTGK